MHRSVTKDWTAYERDTVTSIIILNESIKLVDTIEVCILGILN